MPGRSCWSLPPAFCPRRSGEVPCVASTHPGSSSGRGRSANETLTQLARPRGSVEPCATAASGWDRRQSPLQGHSRVSHHSKRTNPPAHNVSPLCWVLFCWRAKASNFFPTFICQQLTACEEQARGLLLAAIPPAASLQPRVPWGAECPTQRCSLLRASYIQLQLFLLNFRLLVLPSSETVN